MNNREDTIINFYDNYNEDNRMKENPLEYIRCKEIISRYLNNENMRILDIGGATGAFSFWLAQLGHKVSLIDFTPKHIEIARLHQQESNITLESIKTDDARDLPYSENSFDLVLLMGPLYHLTEKEDRKKALGEAYRVLKHNGVLICEVISRYASMVDGFNHGLINDSEFISIMEKDIRTGIHKDTSKSKRYFTNAYFHHADEVSEELNASGFDFKDLIAVTSIGSTISNLNEKIKDEEYLKLLLSTIRTIENDKSLMGISSHYIGVGVKD